MNNPEVDDFTDDEIEINKELSDSLKEIEVLKLEIQNLKKDQETFSSIKDTDKEKLENHLPSANVMIHQSMTRMGYWAIAGLIIGGLLLWIR